MAIWPIFLDSVYYARCAVYVLGPNFVSCTLKFYRGKSMGVDGTIAVLWAQTGLGTQFAHTAAVAPHAQAAMSRMMAQETAKQEQHSVEKTANTEKTGVSKDKEKNKDASLSSKRKKNTDQTAEESLSELFDDPYAGILVNMKI